jgi:hypothetical protein
MSTAGGSAAEHAAQATGPPGAAHRPTGLVMKR